MNRAPNVFAPLNIGGDGRMVAGASFLEWLRDVIAPNSVNVVWDVR